MTIIDPRTLYHVAGPQHRVIMHGQRVVGFAEDTSTAAIIVAALRRHDPDHGCASCEAPLYRVGRSLGRTVYRMVAQAPSKDDGLVALMDTVEDAYRVTAALNHL